MWFCGFVGWWFCWLVDSFTFCKTTKQLNDQTTKQQNNKKTALQRQKHNSEHLTSMLSPLQGFFLAAYNTPSGHPRHCD